LFDRYDVGEVAILVHINFTKDLYSNELEEFQMLVDSTHIQTKGLITGKLKQPNPKYFVGAGKAEEIAQQVRDVSADVVIFNHDLTPAQERDLEKMCCCRVLDRNSLILDIFAQRARSHEGKLQVELAQLKHLSTRLVRGWTHLERQKGGIGLRGPGEKQLETDRRLIHQRIKHISKKIQRVEQQRSQTRQARVRSDVPTIALVGYTNAGKSSLFNLLTDSSVYEADQLFATLDPTVRKLKITDAIHGVLADTVGFIRHLPHELIVSFKATLQEAAQADLLLHVIDISDANYKENQRSVDSVLAQIGAADIPQLIVYNKIDRLSDSTTYTEYDNDMNPVGVWLSAKDKKGISLLSDAMLKKLSIQRMNITFCFPATAARLVGLLYRYSDVLKQEYDEEGCQRVNVKLSKVNWLRLRKETGQEIEKFIELSDTMI
jgi:GTPase